MAFVLPLGPLIAALIGGSGAAISEAVAVTVAGAAVLTLAANLNNKNNHDKIEEKKGNSNMNNNQEDNDNDKPAYIIINEKKKGSINREFPREWNNRTLRDIERSARTGDRSAQKAKKLLNDTRFDKWSN